MLRGTASTALEDPVRTSHRHAPARIVEPLGKCRSRNGVTVLELQVSEEYKRSDADRAIGVTVAISARVLRNRALSLHGRSSVSLGQV
jgi:hypothetical protein